MLGRETGDPEHLTYHAPALESSIHQYMDELITRMRTAHDILREYQWQLRSEDFDDPPPLYKEENCVWMISHCRRCGQPASLQPKVVSPCCMTEVMPNHTYKVVHSGQVLIRNEVHL